MSERNLGTEKNLGITADIEGQERSIVRRWNRGEDGWVAGIFAVEPGQEEADVSGQAPVGVVYKVEAEGKPRFTHTLAVEGDEGRFKRQKDAILNLVATVSEPSDEEEQED